MVASQARVRRACGARRSAALPEALQLLRELLAGRGPVGADVLAQLGDVALDVQLVLLQPGDVELLAGRAAVELARDVLVIVTDNPVRFSKFRYDKPERGVF